MATFFFVRSVFRSWRLVFLLSFRRMRAAFPGTVSVAVLCLVVRALRAPLALGSLAHADTRQARSHVAIRSSTPRFSTFFERTRKLNAGGAVIPPPPVSPPPVPPPPVPLPPSPGSGAVAVHE